MRKLPLAVLVLLGAVVAALFLFLRPNGGLVEEREAVAPSSPTDPVEEPVPGLGDIPEQAATDTAPELEREAVEPAIARGRVAFRLIDYTAHPVAGAQLLIVRGEVLVAEGMTDEQGEVEFAADDEPARLILAVAHRPLEEREFPLEPGRQEILMLEGAHLSGRFVREDGTSPGELSLALNSDAPFSKMPELPPVVESAIRVHCLRGARAIETTDEEGRFEVTGLSDSWSGVLSIRRGWKITSTSHGLEQPFDSGVRLTEPISGLALRIAPLPTWRGRLILVGDGSPLDRAHLVLMIRSPDMESPTFTSTRTDEDGRFKFRRGPQRISNLDLRLGKTFAESPSILTLEGASTPANGDLGDVIVDAARHVPFLLQDPEGTPIEKGSAIAAGVRSKSTGKDGRGELRWIASSVDRMCVEAEGFVPAEVELPPAIPTPLIVTLMHANELVVTLRLPAGADASQFKIVLRGAERITALPFDDFDRQSPHVDPWDSIAHYSFRGVAPDTYLCAHPHGSVSRASFFALRPDVEIELEVHGLTGKMVYHSETLAPLTPTERREVEVPLEEGMIVFRGRVLDQDGNPLEIACLQLTGQILGWTDDEGRFLCFLSQPETGTLLIQHHSCTTKFLRDYAVPIHGEPVEFRLDPARVVTIEVVDESGAPVPQPEVWLENGGFTTNTFRLGENRHTSSVPAEACVFMVRIAGREYRQEYDPSTTEVRIVVPVHGSLVALIPDATTASRSGGTFSLQLTPPEGDPGQPVVESRESAANLRIEIPLVFPGTYRASLRYTPSEEELAAGAEKEFSAPVSITVEPGREVEIRLALP
jgi:hypothetical protein